MAGNVVDCRQVEVSGRESGELVGHWSLPTGGRQMSSLSLLPDLLCSTAVMHL